MSEKPILFSGEMVRAILSGRKTQTRRVIKPQILSWSGSPVGAEIQPGRFMGHRAFLATCPYGEAEDTLWVRETWRTEELDDDSYNPGLDGIRYRADNVFLPIENSPVAAIQWLEARGDHGDKWRPSIHMPRWASRITLQVVDVRVERVQDITDSDALAEGCTGEHFDYPSSDFIWLWDGINAKRGYLWESNPWVWVVEFCVIA